MSKPEKLPQDAKRDLESQDRREADRQFRARKPKDKKPTSTARVGLKIRTADGANLESRGELPDEAAFAIYMLFSGWGWQDQSYKERATAKFQEAAKRFLLATKRFRDRDRDSKFEAEENRLTILKSPSEVEQRMPLGSRWRVVKAHPLAWLGLAPEEAMVGEVLTVSSHSRGKLVWLYWAGNGQARARTPDEWARFVVPEERTE